MATVAFSSQGCTLKVTITATPTVIPGVKTISVPSTNRTIADITNLGSTGNFKEIITLMNDTDSLTFSCVWDPTSAVHDYLYDQSVLAVGVLDVWLFTASDTGTATLGFSGYITKVKPVIGTNEVMMLDVEVAVTGALVYTQ